MNPRKHFLETAKLPTKKKKKIKVFGVSVPETVSIVFFTSSGGSRVKPVVYYSTFATVSLEETYNVKVGKRPPVKR